MESYRRLGFARRSPASAVRRLLCLALFGGALYAQSSQEYFDRGMSLARLNDLPQAAAVFEEGARLFPGDKRFPTELAGIAWREKNGSGAKRYLHTALKIDSADSYGNDFLVFTRINTFL